MCTLEFPPLTPDQSPWPLPPSPTRCLGLCFLLSPSGIRDSARIHMPLKPTQCPLVTTHTIPPDSHPAGSCDRRRARWSGPRFGTGWLCRLTGRERWRPGERASYRLGEWTVDWFSVNKNKLTGSSSCQFCWKQPAPSLLLLPPTLSQSYVQPGRMGLPPKQLAICPVADNGGCSLCAFKSGLGLWRPPRGLALSELVQSSFDEIIGTQYLAHRMCSTNTCWMNKLWLQTGSPALN